MHNSGNLYKLYQHLTSS